MYEKIHRAGMICYRIDPNTQSLSMMFFKPSDPELGGDEFQITKGKIENGETALFTAVREAQEEIGLFKSSIIGEVHELGVFLGRTTFFVCKVKFDALFGMPEEETGDTAWLTEDEFNSIGRELHRPVVREAVYLIKQLEKSLSL